MIQPKSDFDVFVVYIKYKWSVLYLLLYLVILTVGTVAPVLFDILLPNILINF